MQTFLTSEVHFSEIFRLLNDIFITGKPESIKSGLSASLKVWAVHIIELMLELFIDLIDYKALLSAKVCQSHIHPSSNCAWKISLRFSRSDEHNFPSRYLIIRQKSPQLRIELAKIDTFHIYNNIVNNYIIRRKKKLSVVICSYCQRGHFKYCYCGCYSLASNSHIPHPYTPYTVTIRTFNRR